MRIKYLMALGCALIFSAPAVGEGWLYGNGEWGEDAIIAQGEVAYLETKDQCEYAPVVSTALLKMEDYYHHAQPFEWEQTIQTASLALQRFKVMYSITSGGSTIGCAQYGILVRSALESSLLLLGNDYNLAMAMQAEIDRLGDAPGLQQWHPSYPTAGQLLGDTCGSPDNPLNADNYAHNPLCQNRSNMYAPKAVPFGSGEE